MGRPRQITDEQILEAARECFLAEGPGASTVAIADRAKISQAALFKRFSTKRELLLAALAPDPKPAWVHHVEAGPDDRPVREQIHEIATLITDFFTELAPHAAVLRSSGLTPEEIFSRYDVPPPVAGHRALTAWLDAVLDQGRIRPCDTKSVAMALLGALHIRPFFAHIAGLSFEMLRGPDYLATVVDSTWRALAPEDGS